MCSFSREREVAAEGRSQPHSGGVCGWERAAAALAQRRCSSAGFCFRGERRKRLEVEGGGVSTSTPRQASGGIPSEAVGALNSAVRRFWRRVEYPLYRERRSGLEAGWRREEFSGPLRPLERYCWGNVVSVWMCGCL